MIGNNLLKILKEKNITQKDLAATIITDPSYLSGVVKGETLPRIDTCYKIAEALGVQPYDIWFKKSKKEKK